VDVSPDGWTTPHLTLRWQQPVQSRPAALLVVEALHAHPRSNPMRIRTLGPQGLLAEARVPGNGPFTIELPLDDQRPLARSFWRVECLDPFVPRTLEVGSNDARTLGFRVTGVRALAAG
jgi:hypothetical protein